MTAREDDRGRVLRFAEFRRTVADVERSIDFYVGALGFERADDAAAGRARLKLGHETIELVAANAEGGAGRGEPLDVAALPFQHIAIVSRDMAASAARLARWAPAAISCAGPVRLPAEAGGVSAFKFRDPDGHPVELIEFPAGAGDPRWHAEGPGEDDARPLNLGIDHSAIGVADVERSLSFYVEGLGLAAASRHRNHGAAQSSLDGLENSVVEVVGLRPSAQRTPHLELLGRRPPAPRSRSAEAPIERDPGDRIVFMVDDLRAVLRRLAGLAGVDDVATRHFDPSAEDPGAGTCLRRDPDGHLLELRQAGAESTASG